MSEIIITNLKVVAKHGVFDKEKINSQPFLFDCVLEYDFEKAAENDDLNQTLDYGNIMQDISDFCLNNQFDLIETLCYRSAEMIINKYSVKSVKMTVKKPNAPVDLDFENVGVSVHLKRRDVYLSLGSNLGDRKAILDSAVKTLSANRAIDLLQVSPYYENPPYGGVAKYPFINIAVKISTYLSPYALLDFIHATEAKENRNRDVRWGDRTLDIDIIFYGDEIINENGLTVPHSDYVNRDFVLVPLAEISPDFVCPLKRQRISELLKQLTKK
jgi:dihydroneopterin aldolase/2-amino-4-hydroxy-6-hydroxymethyldihydropteridine diphosphokinase